MVKGAFLLLLLCLCCACGFAQTMQVPEYYLSLPEVSEEAKEYYNGKWSAGVSPKAYAIVDSVFTENDQTRPFYIFLVSRMLTEAEGNLLAELNIVSRYVLELHPATLISVLFGSQVTARVREDWVHRVAVETRITCADDLMACFRKSRSLALQNCPAASKPQLETLYNMVRKELNLFQQG